MMKLITQLYSTISHNQKVLVPCSKPTERCTAFGVHSPKDSTSAAVASSEISERETVMAENKKQILQVIKFTLFSVSAGIIQIASFALIEIFIKDYWIPYLTSLILSILWNFTLNRKYTFKSAANVPVAMAKVFGFYLVFTPASTYLGNLAESCGADDFVILICTMLANFLLEFLFCKFVVYRNQENTAKK